MSIGESLLKQGARSRTALALAAVLAATSGTAAGAAGTGATASVAVGRGVAVVFDLGDAAADASVRADLRHLVPDLWDLVPPGIDGADGVEEITVRYRGKGRLGPRRGYPQAKAETGPAPFEDPDTLPFVAFNLATRNEFEVRFPRTLLHRLHAHALARGINREVRLSGAPSSPAGAPAGGETFTPSAWSGNVDNRVRFYGVNAPVTHWERQRVSDFGGCSATLVGPRHVITAAHCMYDPDDADPWADDVWIRVGRNGTSWLDEVYIDNDNIPGGQVLWYWVPGGYISSQHHQYDIGLIVTPRRIGQTTGGWMGWWVLNANTLATQSLWNVGYPACTSFTPDGTPRIDEPNPAPPDFCRTNHLYGDVNTCAPAQYTNQDGDGWSRNFRHRCDASAGNSGSPVYLNFNGRGWGVTGVHIQSLCGTTAGNPCNAADSVRPLRASRVTPEYSGVISFFRNLYP